MLLKHARLTAIVGLSLIVSTFLVFTRTRASVNSNPLTIDFTEKAINSNSVIIQDNNVKNSLALIQKLSFYIHTSNEGQYSIDPEIKNRLSVKDTAKLEKFVAFINTLPLNERQQHLITPDIDRNRATIAKEITAVSRNIGMTITPDRCVLLGYWGQFRGEWKTWKCYLIILQSNEPGAYGLVALS